MKRHTIKKTGLGRILIIGLLLLCSERSVAQQTFFGEEDVTWENNRPPLISKQESVYSAADLVILNEVTQFYFYAADNEKISKHVVIKINNAEGLRAVQAYKLPESFDYAYDACLFKSGRRSAIKIPYITDFALNKLAARRFRHGKWNVIPFDYKYETVKWINSTGKFANDNVSVFKFKDLAEGDIVEIFYELQFNSNYGSNLFYFNSRYPKLNCEYEFIYKLSLKASEYACLLPIHVPDSALSHSVVGTGAYLIKKDKIKLTDLQGINYPANSCEGKSLPHVFIDFTFYRVLTNYYSSDVGKVAEYQLSRARNFEWVFFKDTTSHYVKIYDKKSLALRKFVATLPLVGTDSSHKTFLNALCDTLNSFRYITINQLFYNESQLYDLSSADHLLKRRLVSPTFRVWQDILNDNGIFYYVANIEDNRYGDHSLHYRAHLGYEGSLFAVPSGNSYLYFMPRTSGVAYHLNELPFYYEGSIAALFPRNFQESTEDKDGKTFKFIKTHKGSFNENTRTENATVTIPVDSLRARLVIKESLSGQFSTVLRHLYLNESIDSTIAPFYFKKCTQKPNALEPKIRLSSHVEEFPFRYSFNCSEKINRPAARFLELKNWFSFLISRESFPEKPNHDYYMDFEFSDAYNFLLNFSAPVDIKNADAFSKTISNAFFELKSEIVKNSDAAYLVSVKLIVKERKIPLDKMDLLMDLVSSLDELNNFTLQLAKL